MPARLRHCEWGAPPRFRASVAREPLSGSKGREGGVGGATIHEPGDLSGAETSTLSQRRSGAMARVVTLLLILALLAVALAAAPAGAEEPKKLEPVIVTGTLIETPAEQVGATV